MTLLLILTIGLSLLFFGRSWFVFNNKKTLSLLILLGSIGAHPEVGFFLGGPQEAIFISLLFSGFAMLLSFFIPDKTMPLAERIIRSILVISLIHTTTLLCVMHFHYYIGYYHADVANGIIFCYILAVALILYRFYSIYKSTLPPQPDILDN